MPFFPGVRFLAPGPTYIAPSSSFFLSSGGAPASLIDFLPSRMVADRLLAQYWQAVYPIARTVHRPSFQRRYDAFWNDVTSGIEPPNSLQAVIFAAMFSGVVSMPDDTIVMQFGVAKKGLVDNFQMGTETALGRANFIRTAKLETLQAFIMYMVGDLLFFHTTFILLQTIESCCFLLASTSRRLSLIPSYLALMFVLLDPSCLVHRVTANGGTAAALPR